MQKTIVSLLVLVILLSSSTAFAVIKGDATDKESKPLLETTADFPEQVPETPERPGVERKEHYPPLSLLEGLESGALVLVINGTGTTTRMTCTLTNKTSDGCTVIIPTGTPLETKSKDHQPYQTGYIPPIELGPGETETVEVPAFCTDSEKKPAPADGSVTYALHKGPLTPKQEKVTEIIVVTNVLKQLHETCGKVAEPDDFIGPPPPPAKPEPEGDEFAPLPPPEAGPLPVGPLALGPKVTYEELLALLIIKEIWYYRLEHPFPEPAPPEGFEGIPKPPPGLLNFHQG